MSPILRNILAVIAGIIAGWIVNMGIIVVSDQIIAPPPGVNVADMESLKANIDAFSPRHFIFPFLAHALGTFVGAYTTARLATSHNMKFALGIGVFFLLGGIAAVVMIGGPLWFNILDIVAAYIPMAWLGGKMAINSASRT